MPRRPMPHLVAALACLLSTAVMAQSDNFDDNTTGPQWSLVLDSASELSLTETNGRVEAVTAVTASTPLSTDALYLSNGVSGFTMSTASDFTLMIDYTLGPATDIDGPDIDTAMAMVFGVGTDASGSNSAAIGVSVSLLGTQAIGAERTGGSDNINLLGSESTSGQMTITYDASEDDLTLSSPSQSFTLNDTVKAAGVWNASELLVSFGFRGNGYNLAAGGTYFDNFTAVPEPATAVLLLGAVVAASPCRRRGH